MKIRDFFAIALCAAAGRPLGAQAQPAAVAVVPTNPAGRRLTLPFDDGWNFHLNSPQDAPAPAQRTWRTVNLPFDWSIEGPFDPFAAAARGGAYLPTGAAVFRKTFTLPVADAGQRVEIQFDGIMANGEVFINGHSVGRRPNGYVGVNYDLTKYVTWGTDQPNTLEVTVDNGIQPASRYYTGSGIERHVRLVVTNPVHVQTWGVYVTTPTVTPEAATVHVETTVANDSTEPSTVTLQTGLEDPDTRVSLSRNYFSTPQTILPGQSVTFKQDIPVAQPKLWGLDHPTLYRADVMVLDGNARGVPQNDAKNASASVALDEATADFGIRQIEFKPETGFWLNGQNIKLLGVCLHEDGGALGEAVPRSVYAARLAAIKSLGANAVRLAHNPPDPVLLDLCDRAGLLVMDEMFDCWTVGKPNAEKGYNLFFSDWSLADLRDAVLRDRNHPSIILWSAGNEIHDTPQQAKALAILQGLVAAFHQYDPSRPVTQALFRPEVSHDYTNGLADLLDVVGTNYRDSELIAAQQAKPTRTLVSTEEHQDAKTWVYVRDHPPLAGCFLWAAIDYLGEGYSANRPPGVDDPGGAWPNISDYEGMIDRSLWPRASAFERASWWSTQPVLRLVRSSDRNPPRLPNVPPTYSLLPDWTPTPGNNYPRATVSALSNCEEVELFLNGQSLGAKTLPKDASARTWTVPYAPGTLRAVGRDGGKEVANDELVTAGPAAKITLVPDHTQATPTFDDVVLVRAFITDANGTRVPYADNAVTFKVAGPGAIVATDNGRSDDHTVFSSPIRTAQDGTCLAYLRATAGAGPITLTASADGLQSGTATLQATPVPANR